MVPIRLRSCSNVSCTNVLVTKGASADGSSFLTYTADSHEMYGELRITPARRHPEGSTRP